MTGSCMETRNVIILLLCLVSAAVLVTGCTSQTFEPVTTVPTTMVPAPVITLTSVTVMTTGTLDTTTRTGTLRIPKTSMSTTTTGISTATSTDNRSERVRIKARNFALMFHGSRFLPVRRSLLSSKMKIVPHIMWLSIQSRL